MYHYVRDLKNSRYPQIKGLDLTLFIEQIDYLKKHYNFITMEMLIDSMYNKTELPPKAVLLTFDDAYSEHFNNVFPILFNRKIQGSFYVPFKAIIENNVLDVNKIHFILASVSDFDKLMKKTYQELDKYRAEFQLESNEYYFDKLAMASRMDPKEVIFFKRLLQKELPESLRNLITDNLFQEIVGIEEKAFSKELYMNMEQLKCMIDNGMHIGNHGYDHYWLNSISETKQREEVSKGCYYLNQLGVNMNNWTICYPYGAYNQSLINILKENNCKLGFTSMVDVADIDNCNQFELPRLDTNDLPKDKNASLNDWYNKA